MRLHSKRAFRIVSGAIAIALMILMAANALLLLKSTDSVEALSADHQPVQSLPCPAVPTRLILEDPTCVQKLL